MRKTGSSTRWQETTRPIAGATRPPPAQNLINLVYAKEVAVAGREIFTSNRFESERFLATCLSMYSELQQQREEVLDTYTA